MASQLVRLNSRPVVLCEWLLVEKPPATDHGCGLPEHNHSSLTSAILRKGLFRFPRVEAVTELVVRRQYYRDIAPGVFSKLLKESFTSLQKFRYELWENVEAAFQHWYMEGILNQISYS